MAEAQKTPTFYRIETKSSQTPAKADSITKSPANGLITRCMRDVEVEPVEYLWKPYLPIAKLSSLEGDPGIAKTWISLAIATAVSRGRELPGQVPGEPHNVLMASAEDGYGDTFRPRLDSMGADLNHIFVIDETFNFDDAGFAQLEDSLSKLYPKLLVIDPLQAYLGAGMNLHMANQTRPVLTRLGKLAAKYQLVILVIRHLSKGGTNKAIYRGIGSIDFTAAFRSVLLAGCDPENANNLAIVHIKSNLAKKGPTQGYQLRDDNFCWTGESTLTQAQILAGDDSSGSVSELAEAIAFLKEGLADGALSQRNVYQDAKGVGISERTLNRAKAQLGVITRHLGEKGKRGGGDWTWELPAGNIDIATKLSGNLNNSVANKSASPKKLATSISEKIVTDDGPSYDPPYDPVDDIPPDDNPLKPREKEVGVWYDKDGNPNVGYRSEAN